jgi:uridylate kinase
MKKPVVVLSLGGSLVVPGDIDVVFLKKFAAFIRKNLRRFRFIITVGGGRINSRYNAAARALGARSKESLDWIGIYTTWLNAQLIRVIFGNLSEGEIQTNPHKKTKFTKSILVAAGHKPGASTDTDTVILAKQYGARKVINLSNISHVYTADPRKNKTASKITEISWKNFLKLVGTKWTPRMNAPFDPVASQFAMKHKMTVIVAGKDLVNLQKILDGKDFIGTKIG